MDEKILKLRKMIENSRRLCVFTGAGISCPSGIPDFRSASGLYNQKSAYPYPPEQMLSASFFKTHTKEFFDFYRSSMVFPNAKPNEAHKYFASLENGERKVSVVTQNIDSLHSAAGSTDVIELHGSVKRNRCQKCKKSYPLEFILSSDSIPRCDCGGIVKPDVVLYEEPLDEETVRRAILSVRSADCLIIVGTSLSVYPAASYVGYFRGENLAIINKGETGKEIPAALSIDDDIIHVIHELER